MAYVAPTVAEFKSYFNRDFPYSEDINLGVADADITKALNRTAVTINSELFCDQATYTIGFLLLSAHYMVMNIRASSQGLASQYSWVQTSRSAGSVSEGLQVPDRIMANPEFAMLTKTGYGADYLMMILPLLSGQIFIAGGGTQA